MKKYVCYWCKDEFNHEPITHCSHTYCSETCYKKQSEYIIETLQDWQDRNCDASGNCYSDADPGL